MVVLSNAARVENIEFLEQDQGQIVFAVYSECPAEGYDVDRFHLTLEQAIELERELILQIATAHLRQFKAPPHLAVDQAVRDTAAYDHAVESGIAQREPGRRGGQVV